MEGVVVMMESIWTAVWIIWGVIAVFAGAAVILFVAALLLGTLGVLAVAIWEKLDEWR